MIWECCGWKSYTDYEVDVYEIDGNVIELLSVKIDTMPLHRGIRFRCSPKRVFKVGFKPLMPSMRRTTVQVALALRNTSSAVLSPSSMEDSVLGYCVSPYRFAPDRGLWFPLRWEGISRKTPPRTPRRQPSQQLIRRR